MVKFWDNLVKRLIGKMPQDFVSWFVSGAQFVGELSPHLQTDGLDADALYEIAVGEQHCLLHVEFQTRGDAKMGERLILYNTLARRKYKMPVYSSVVYLLKGKKALTSPYEWETWDGPEKSIFHFRAIKLWEIPTTTLLEHQQPGLIPLLLLSYEGRRMAVVDQVVESLSLLDGKLQEALSPLAYSVALKLFPNPVDQIEVRRRFDMFRDFVEEMFRESGLLQEMEEKFRKEIEEKAKKEIEEEMKQRMTKQVEEEMKQRVTKQVEEEVKQRVTKQVEEEVKQRTLQEVSAMKAERLRNNLVALVEARFSGLTGLAKAQAALIEDAEQLEHLYLKVGISFTSDEARRSLLEADKN